MFVLPVAIIAAAAVFALRSGKDDGQQSGGIT
jgi:hypothetical protein